MGAAHVEPKPEFSTKTAKNDLENISVKDKKKKFISDLFPVIQNANQDIIEKRNIFFEIEKKIESNNLNVLEAAILKKLFNEYKVKNNDLAELKKRIDIVPISLVIAQAAIETGWGKSRFANEGNNLFGIRTWNKDEPYLLPIPWTEWPGWGVKVYETRCDSVRDYLRILNEVFAFTEFRAARDSGIDDGLILADYLSLYASNQNYTELVKEVIKYNIRGEYDI